MPAVTVPDIAALPRVSVPAAGRARPVKSVTTAPKGFEGEGFPVRRAFAGVDLADLDPFIHLDQIGEVDYAPGEPKGTPWHPHRGFETVTYMIDGVIAHADSTGGGGVISDGDTQWMTAGKGILHIETPPEEVVMKGGLFHGLQLWVNLPAAQKWVDPRYQDLQGSAVTLVASDDAGSLLRVVAGAVDGHAGPGSTRTPMTMVHASVSPAGRVVVPWPHEFNALVYVLGGAGFVGEERAPVATGQLALLGAGDTVVVEAAGTQSTVTPTLELLLLGGRPIGESVAWYGPFVMNTRDEIVQAVEDFQAGRLGTIPAASAEEPVAFQTDSSLD